MVEHPALGNRAHTGTLEIYSQGLRLQSSVRHRIIPAKSGGGIRGEIKTMSSAASRRLRDHLLLCHVPHYAVWDVTLTIPGEVTVEEWDKAKRALFMRWNRANWAAVWRVELQRRFQPHLHLVLFTDYNWSEKFDLIVKAWLDVLPEKNRAHPGASSHAVHWQGPYNDVTQSPEWYAYLAAHASKKKESQLGWQGKQWGIVRRDLFVEREPLIVKEIDERQEKMIKRTLARWRVAKVKNKRKKLAKKGIKTRGKVRRQWWREGACVTRLGNPEVFKRLAQWVYENSRNDKKENIET